MSNSNQPGLGSAISALLSGGYSAVGSGLNAANSFLGSTSRVLNDVAVKPVSNIINHGTPMPSAQALKQYEAKLDAADAAEARQSGGDIWAAGLGGLGAGVALARLQRLLSGTNKPVIKYKKFVSGPKDVDEEEKLAFDPINAVVSAPGNLVQAIADDKTNRETAKAVLMLGASALGLHGGSKLVKQLAEKNRQAELQAEVENAKKEYQRALIGKRASADLVAAFHVFEKTSRGESKLPGFLQTIVGLLDASQFPFKATGTHIPYWTANAGLGALSTKMVYDWTRERGKDKALAEAQKARARLAGAPSIYVDPEQLAKIKEVAD